MHGKFWGIVGESVGGSMVMQMKIVNLVSITFAFVPGANPDVYVDFPPFFIPIARESYIVDGVVLKTHSERLF